MKLYNIKFSIYQLINRIISDDEYLINILSQQFKTLPDILKSNLIVKKPELLTKYKVSDKILIKALQIEDGCFYKARNLIKYIRNPSYKVQLFAIKHRPYRIFNIENPSKKILFLAWDSMLFSTPSNIIQIPVTLSANDTTNLPLTIQKKIIQHNPTYIVYISNPYDSTIIETILLKPELLNYQTQLLNMAKCSGIIKWDLKNLLSLSYNVQKAILKVNPLLIKQINNLDIRLINKYSSLIQCQDIGVI